ncbi:MAG: serine/threonine protein kinase [Flavobacteriaceae bacterium]|nr:MAG: serine/threonine protein kinase [Flavobacteriaceae bacterium]
MKTQNLFAIAFFALLFSSCKNQGTKKVEESKIEESKIENSVNDALAVEKDSVVIQEIHKEYYGLYSGEFSGKYMEQYADSPDESYVSWDTKRLTIKINRITTDSVYGQSIVNGNQRPFRGVFNESKKSFVLDEPGDDKTDGRFELKLISDSLNGSWNAYKKSAVKAPNKTLKLVKKEFVYNPNFMIDEYTDLVDWESEKVITQKETNTETGETETYNVSVNRSPSEAVFELNASKQKLTEKDLKNLRKLDLEIIKNSVYARHGYSFKKPTFRYFFEQTNWYIPVSDNVEAEITPMEKENILLLSRFIKYAEDKYDYFGR